MSLFDRIFVFLSLTFWIHPFLSLVNNFNCPTFPKIGSPINLFDEYIGFLSRTFDASNHDRTIRLINYSQNAKSNLFSIFFEVKTISTNTMTYIGMSGAFNSTSNSTYRIEKYIQTPLFNDLSSFFGGIKLSQNHGFFCKYFKEHFWIRANSTNYFNSAMRKSAFILKKKDFYLSNSDINPPNSFLFSKNDIFVNAKLNPYLSEHQGQKYERTFIGNSSDLEDEYLPGIESHSLSDSSFGSNSILATLNKNNQNKIDALNGENSSTSLLKSDEEARIKDIELNMNPSGRHDFIQPSSSDHSNGKSSANLNSTETKSAYLMNDSQSEVQNLMFSQKSSDKITLTKKVVQMLINNPNDAIALSILDTLNSGDKSAVKTALEMFSTSQSKKSQIQNMLLKDSKLNAEKRTDKTDRFAFNIVSRNSQQAFLKEWLEKKARLLETHMRNKPEIKKHCPIKSKKFHKTQKQKKNAKKNNRKKSPKTSSVVLDLPRNKKTSKHAFKAVKKNTFLSRN